MKNFSVWIRIIFASSVIVFFKRPIQSLIWSTSQNLVNRRSLFLKDLRTKDYWLFLKCSKLKDESRLSEWKSWISRLFFPPRSFLWTFAWPFHWVVPPAISDIHLKSVCPLSSFFILGKCPFTSNTDLALMTTPQVNGMERATYSHGACKYTAHYRSFQFMKS